MYWFGECLLLLLFMKQTIKQRNVFFQHSPVIKLKLLIDNKQYNVTNKYYGWQKKIVNPNLDHLLQSFTMQWNDTQKTQLSARTEISIMLTSRAAAISAFSHLRIVALHISSSDRYERSLTVWKQATDLHRKSPLSVTSGDTRLVDTSRHTQPHPPTRPMDIVWDYHPLRPLAPARTTMGLNGYNSNNNTQKSCLGHVNTCRHRHRPSGVSAGNWWFSFAGQWCRSAFPVTACLVKSPPFTGHVHTSAHQQ